MKKITDKINVVSACNMARTIEIYPLQVLLSIV